LFNIYCLFAHFNTRNTIDEYVYTYLGHLSDLGCRIIFISNSPIADADKTTLTTRANIHHIEVRINKGADFGAWKWAIENNMVPNDADYLLLTNDSVYGPVFPLAPIIERMQLMPDVDFWGLTDNYQTNWHLQSYFLFLSKKVFTAAAFQDVFRNDFEEFNKLQIIENGEVQLTQALLEAGFKGASYIPYKNLDPTFDGTDIKNPTHYFWDILITKYNFPFIKKELVLHNPESLSNVSQIFPILDQYPLYPVEIVKQSILDYLSTFSDPELITHNTSVFCHLYYPETIYFFLSKLAALKSPKTWFIINLSSALYYNTHFCDLLTRFLPGATILYTPNQGRDIGGKFAALDVQLRAGIDTDFSLIIHDKVSPHTPTGLLWRNNLLKIIDPENLPKVFKKLENDDTGVLTALDFIKNEYDADKDGFNCTSSENLKSYMKKYQLKVTDYNFAAGTIFWIKTSILKKFFSVNTPLAVRQELEKGNALDFDKGTNIHAWERLFSFIAFSQGFKTKGI
jgi:lipopolysaccharide biosynthesis protein